MSTSKVRPAQVPSKARRSAPVQAPAPLATTPTASASASLAPVAPRPAVDAALAALDRDRVNAAAWALAYILECVDECSEPLTMAMHYLDNPTDDLGGVDGCIKATQHNLRALAFQIEAIRGMVVQVTGDMTGRKKANVFQAMSALTDLAERTES